MSPGSGQPQPQRFVGQQLRQALGQPIHVVGIDDKARFAIVHHFARAAKRGRDRGCARRHAFKIHHHERFKTDRRRRDYVGQPVGGRQLGIFQPAAEHDLVDQVGVVT